MSVVNENEKTVYKIKEFYANSASYVNPECSVLEMANSWLALIKSSVEPINHSMCIRNFDRETNTYKVCLTVMYKDKIRLN